VYLKEYTKRTNKHVVPKHVAAAAVTAKLQTVTFSNLISGGRM
jgi:hypothetical protein